MNTKWRLWEAAKIVNEMGCKNRRNAWKLGHARKAKEEKGESEERWLASWKWPDGCCCCYPLLVAISRCSPSTIEIAPFLMRAIE